MTVNASSLIGTAMIHVDAVAGSTTYVETFMVDFADTAPQLTQPSDQTLPHNQQATVSLNGSAFDGGTLTYSARSAATILSSPWSSSSI